MKAKTILHTGVATVVESAKGDGRRWGARDERRSDDEADAMGTLVRGSTISTSLWLYQLATSAAAECESAHDADSSFLTQ